MIRILNSPSLTGALYETVNFCKDNHGQEIEIIVPDKLSLYMEKFIFEELKIECSFNIKVSTLNRFAKRNITIQKENQISKVGSIILIHKILNENIDKLQVLKSRAYSFTYAEEIYSTIAQLKSSKITYEEMSKFSSLNAQLQDKIHDLALVYKLYEEGKVGLLDSQDVFLMSTLHVADNVENKKIVIVGFDDFTAIEYAIIERLAISTEVNVINYNNANKNKHIYNNEVYSQLKNIAYINELKFETIDVKTDLSPLNSYLESNIFALSSDKLNICDESLRIYSGRNISLEIEFVARDIRRKILDGAQYSSFGVGIYNIANNVEIVKEIFSKYEINYYIDAEFSIEKSIFYKFILSVFKFNLEGFLLTHLIDIINSPFFVMDNDKKNKLIECLINVNFRGKSLDRLELGEEFSEDKDYLQQFVNHILIDKDANISTIEHMLIEWQDVFKIEDIINDISTTLDVRDKLILTKSIDVISNIFVEIKKFYPASSLSEIYDIFLHVSSVVNVNNLPLTLDAVKVVDANNSMEIFDNLYIVNCTAENAPNLKFDCGIILDSEISELNFEFKLSPTIAHINRLSRLRLYNMALLFKHSLTITYSGVASELIKDILKKVVFDTPYSMPITNLNFGKYLALSKWDLIDYNCRNNLVDCHSIDLENKKNLVNISKDNVDIYENMKTISASQLENYFKCPFYYFADNILRIKPRLDSEIQSFDIGNILHELLYMYYKKEKKVGDTYEFCRNQVFKFIDKDNRLKLNIKSPMITNLIDEAVRVINGVNYIDANSSFKPNKNTLELAFRDSEALGTNIELIGKVDRVDFAEDFIRIIDYKSGSVDASLKELYYGNKLQLFLYSVAIENMLKKRVVGEFYLPLHNEYRDVLDNPYSLIGYYEANEGVIRSLDNRLAPSEKSDIVNLKLTKSGEAYRGSDKVLASDEMLDLKQYSIALSNNAVTEIRSGFIKPTPSEVSKPCNYCPYAHICLRASNDIKYRSASKVSLNSFKRGEK